MSLVSALGVGVIPAPNMVFYVAAVGFSFISLLMAIFLIPESLPKRNRKPFQLKGTFGNPLAGAAILMKSKAMTILTVCVVVVVVADVGTQDVFMYYLNDSVGFTDQDNALFFVEMSIMSLIGYFVVTPIMMRYVSSITVLCIAVTANAALLVLTATVWSPWCVFAFIGPLYGLLVMSTPLLNAMITNIGHERDVGKRITAMTAVVDFCGAAGPLIFGILYGQLPHALMALPFLVFAVMIMVCVVAQWKLLGRAIRDDQAKVQEELRQEAIDRGEAAPEGDGDDGAATAAIVAVTDANGASPVEIGRGLYNDEDCE
jgi:DHA1 family tetracycline resistance protein-like MFS transporter